MSRKIREYKETISLTGENIDRFSGMLQEALEEMKLERQNRIRIRIAVEECLLMFRDRYGEGYPIEIRFINRLGRPHILMEAEGEAFNPISAEMGDWSEGLFSSAGFVPQYNYIRGRNVVRMTLPSQRMNLTLRTVILIALGTVVGGLMNICLNNTTKAMLTQDVLQPIFRSWSEVLTTVAGPVIFLMILSTMMDAGLINRMGGSYWDVLKRYLRYTVLIAVVAELGSLVVFRPQFTIDHLGRGLVKTIIGTMEELIPDSVLEPFAEANTPQILLMTFLIGTVILAIKDRVGVVTDFIKQMGIIGMEVAVLLSRLVPYVAMLFAITKMIGKTPWFLIGVWKPLLTAIVMGSIILMVILLYVCLTQKVSVRVMVSKLAPSFLTVLGAGRLDAAYGMTEKCCWNQLGIQKAYTKVSMPYGLVLFVPIGVAGVLIFTIYAASFQGLVLSPLWLIGAIFLTITIYEVTPPLPGIDLITYIAIFQQMGIEQDSVIVAMIFDIMFCLFASAMNQALLQLELVLQARRYGLLNLNTLHRPVNTGKRERR